MKYIQNLFINMIAVGLVLSLLGCANKPSERTTSAEPQVEASVDTGVADRRESATTESRTLVADATRDPVERVEDRAPASTETVETPLQLNGSTTEAPASQSRGLFWLFAVAAIVLIIYMAARAARARRRSPGASAG